MTKLVYTEQREGLVQEASDSLITYSGRRRRRRTKGTYLGKRASVDSPLFQFPVCYPAFTNSVPCELLF